jgi:hypothetical protein
MPEQILKYTICTVIYIKLLCNHIKIFKKEQVKTCKLYCIVGQNKRRNRAKISEKAKSQNGEIARNHKRLWLLPTVVTVPKPSCALFFTSSVLLG